SPPARRSSCRPWRAPIGAWDSACITPISATASWCRRRKGTAISSTRCDSGRASRKCWDGFSPRRAVVDRDEVRRIATLARLEIPESGMERMATELSAVLEFVAALGKLDLSGLDPMTFAPEDAPLRQDALDERCLGAEAALA